LKWAPTQPSGVTDPLETLPDRPRVFDGPADRRFVALALETLVQDMSPPGDGTVAAQLGRYTLGRADPPAAAPEYVSLDGDRVRLDNPPFIVGEFRVAGPEADAAGDREGYRVEAALSSELNLLIDPPVEMRFEGSLSAAVESVEGTLAHVYRTKGRYLEQIDAGVAEPGEG